MKLLHSRNPIERARKTMRENFENDPDFLLAYEANVAMLLYDKFGGVFKDYKIRNDAARDILKLIFWDK